MVVGRILPALWTFLRWHPGVVDPVEDDPGSHGSSQQEDRAHQDRITACQDDEEDPQAEGHCDRPHTDFDVSHLDDCIGGPGTRVGPTTIGRSR